MSKITHQKNQRVIRAWKKRIKALGYIRGTKSVSKLELDFVTDSFALLYTLGLSYPPLRPLIVKNGRCLIETFSSDKEASHE